MLSRAVGACITGRDRGQAVEHVFRLEEAAQIRQGAAREHVAITITLEPERLVPLREQPKRGGERAGDYWTVYCDSQLWLLFSVPGGLPVPEETVLALAGYLVWSGRLQLLPVLVVGVFSAVAGDNLGYWLGRQYGRRAVERYSR
jgi:hypothetical protein